jgi:hypothetical protein
MYPGLHAHLYQNFPGLEKGKVWDSYVENHTPGAWRMDRTRPGTARKSP